MKLLFDFLPVILFFASFKYAEAHKEWAADRATDWLGFMVSGGVVGQQEAPVLLATVVVIAATAAQIAWLLARRQKIDKMLWVSLGLVTVLGGATIWFHSETFIKWKPSVLYWAMAAALWTSQALFRKNLLQAMMGQQVDLPAAIWLRLNIGWVAFFVFMGLLNIYVAYSFPTSTWVNFKLFGSLGMTIVFMVAQGIYLSRHLKHEEQAAKRISTPEGS
jgi:intracellular septation protein